MTLRYGSSAQDPTVLPTVPLNAQNTQGDKVTLESHLNIPIGFVATEQIIFGRIRSNAKIDPRSIMYYGALTSTTSFDLGLFAESAPFVIDSTKGTDNCLIDALDVHLAGSKDFSAKIAIANHGKYAWEIAGLAADPGGWLLVVGTNDVGTSTAAADFSVHVDSRLT